MKHNALMRLLALTLTIAMVLGMGVTGVSAEESSTSSLSYEVLDPDSVSAQLTSSDLEVEETPLYEDDDMVRVSIVLEDDPALTAAGDNVEEYSRRLEEKQKALADEISTQALDGQELDVVWYLTLVANAISARVEYGKIKDIEEIPGVAYVRVETMYMPMVSAEVTNIVSQQMTGANTVQSSGYTGAGTRIAIIDTGIDTDHQSFAEAPYEQALSELPQEYDLLDVEELEEVLTSLNAYEMYTSAGHSLTAEDLYISSKLPFGFNYVDNSLDVTHDNDSQGSHGSHVAGIAAANRYIASERIYGADGHYDFDGDGDQDVDDIQALMDYYIQGREIDNLSYADINGDGEVTDLDAHIFLDMLEESYLDAADSVGVTGVAPDAQLITMKVFGQSTDGSSESDYVAAIEDALRLGCTTINMSLGLPYSGFAHSYSNVWYDEVIKNLEETDVVLCCSAGNAGNWADQDDAYQLMYADEGGTATTGTPSTYTNALAVASAENVGSVKSLSTVFSGVGGEVELIFSSDYVSGGVNEPWETMDPDYVGETYEAVFLGDPTELLSGEPQTKGDIYGEAADFEGYDFTGKVVFIARGSKYAANEKKSVSFSEKHMNAAAAGAAAVVLYNNQSGLFGASLASDTTSGIVGSTATIPLGVATLDEAKQIFKLFTKNSDGLYTGTFTVTKGLVVDNGEENAPIAMSDFSSWGTTGSLAIKPEITAPGGGIYSVNGVDKSGSAYESMSGTSMASPHTAGIAALANQYLNQAEWTKDSKYDAFSIRNLIQSLMMSTAEPILEEESGYLYSVRNQGAGLVNVQNLVSAQSFVMVDGQDDGKVKAELGDGTEARTFSFTIYNHGESAITYDLSATILTPATVRSSDGKYQLTADTMTALDAAVTFSTGNAVTVAAGGSQKVTVTIAVTEAAAKKQMEELGHTNGFYIEGYVYATPKATAEGVQDATHSIPLLGWYGNWSDPSMFDIGTATDYLYGMQEDGKLEKPSHINSMGKNFLGFGIGSSMSIYPGNLYNHYDDDGNLVAETEYLEARNAMNVTDGRSIGIFPTLIRNAMDVDLVVTDEKGKELHREDFEYEVGLGSFYYINSSAWYDTTAGLVVSDWSWAENMKEGTRLTMTLYAAPEYYVMDEDKYFENSIDELCGYEMDDSKWETLGKGTTLSYSFSIDNTAPQLESMTLDKETGNLTFTVKDNLYVAAVVLLDGYGRNALKYHFPNMAVDAKGESHTGSIEFDMTEYAATYGKRAVLAVCDYAGNTTYYAVNLDGVGKNFGDLVAFQHGDGVRNPVSSWAGFSHEVNKDEYVLFTDTTVVATAEYVNGYVFAQDKYGHFYGIKYEDMAKGAISGLETTYITTLDRVYSDLAFNYANGTLYGLYITEYDGYPTIHINTIDLNTYDETPFTDQGGIYGLAMAIDDAGKIYIMGEGCGLDGTWTGTAHLWTLKGTTDFTGFTSYQKVDLGDTGVKMDMLQSMAFDHNNEKLYWAQFYATGWKDMEQNLYEVNPETAECTKVGTLSTETSALFAPLSEKTAAKDAHKNVPTFDATKPGHPILNQDTLTMSNGTTQALTCTFSPWYSESIEVVWSSDDTSVATVDEKGRVKAVGKGTCTITVANKEDTSLTDTCTVTVASISVTIEGIVSQSTGTTASVSNSRAYTFKMDDGAVTMTLGKAVTASEDLNMGLDIAAAVEAKGSIWATEWGNTGMTYVIDPETMAVKDALYPINGGNCYSLSYSAATEMFTGLMNHYLYVDQPLTTDVTEDIINSYDEEKGMFTWHAFDMSSYLAASNTGFKTGETGQGAVGEIVFCGVTTIDEAFTNEYPMEDYLGNQLNVDVCYTSTVTHVLLDNVGRLWYIDEICDLNVVKYEEYGTTFYVDDEYLDSYSGTCFYTDSENPLPNGTFVLEETDEEGKTTANVFFIRKLEETPLTDQFRAGTMPRYTYMFSDLAYAGKSETGQDLFAMSLYDYWNNGVTNRFYLYEAELSYIDWDLREVVTLPDNLYELGTTGDTYLVAPITKVTYSGGLHDATTDSES